MDLLFNKPTLKGSNKENKAPSVCDTAESTISLAMSDNTKSSFTSRSASPEPLKELRSNRSVSSVRTTSSMSNLVDGRLPIESNRTHLVWGCVAVGSSGMQKFVVRNKCDMKVSMKAVVNGINFRILKDHSESEPVTVLPLLLHPRESRPITVVFAPTAKGKVAERLNFYPISEDLQKQQSKSQRVILLGYGGHSSISIQNVAKDSTGKMWVSPIFAVL